MSTKDAGQAGSGEHTPTPWVYSPHRTTHDSIIHTVDAVPNEQGYIDDGGVIGSSEWIWLKPEDAAFIVLACNSHASLSAENATLREQMEAMRRGADLRKAELRAVVTVLESLDLTYIQQCDAEYVDPLPDRLHHHVNGQAVRQRRELLRAIEAVEKIANPPALSPDRKGPCS